MTITRKRGFFESSRILYLPVDSIVPNRNQPRTRFSGEGLRELADSIQANGILQPLSVRRCGRGYELISGERRLRAAKLAQLPEVPCLLVSAGESESALLAQMENLQRRDLDFLEEATALERLISTYHLSQEEAARRLGKSQPAIANKLRLLRLPRDVLLSLQAHGLTERHARALLRLSSEEQQRAAAQTIMEQQLTVARSEALVEAMLAEQTPDSPPRKRNTTLLVKDVRLFLNSIDHNMEIMRRAGFSVTCGREETEESIQLTISIPKAAQRNKS